MPGTADLTVGFVTEHAADTTGLEIAAAQLKERIYATITMISVVIGLGGSSHVAVLGSAATVTTAAVGLWLASLVADQQAHGVRFRGRGRR